MRRAADCLWPALGAGLYLALYFACLFRPCLLRMDDFGYLQSVLDTLALGRLHSHDWLGPYNAPWTALGALSYLATGDFVFSTWGLLPVFSVLNLLLLYFLLRPSFSAPAASLFSLVLATQPVYWYKSAEYAGNVPTLTFVFAALLMYRRGHWPLFFLAAFLAFATRQNSLALLALPAWHLLRGNAPGTPRKWAIPLGLAAFAVTALLLHASLNRTLAQTQDVFAGLGFARALAIVRTLVIGLALSLAFLSALDALFGFASLPRLRQNLRRPWIPAAGLFFVALLYLPHEPYVSFLTPLIGTLDHGFKLQLLLAIAVPLGLCGLDWSLIRFDARAALIAAYLGISSLRGFWYDFYLLEVFFAALFYFLSRRAELRLRPAAGAALAVAVAAHLGWAYAFKIHSDKQWTDTWVYERLERQGKLQADDMTDAPFGMLGWKLYDHFSSHEAPSDMANFQCYVRRDRVVVETELPWRRAFKRDVPEGKAVLDEGATSIGFFPVRYRAVALDAETDPICVFGYIPLARDSYHVKPLPLDATEWNALARRALAVRRRGGPVDGWLP